MHCGTTASIKDWDNWERIPFWPKIRPIVASKPIGKTEMWWDPKDVLKDFVLATQLAHVPIESNAIQIETLPMPHTPTSLPEGKMAVYVFSDRERAFKVGKAGPETKSRYKTQHYTGSAPSTLAGFLLDDPTMVGPHGLSNDNVSRWIKENMDRVNLTLDANAGPFVLALLESFVHCRLKPVYEHRKRRSRHRSQ